MQKYQLMGLNADKTSYCSEGESEMYVQLAWSLRKTVFTVLKCTENVGLQ